jgi:hypothetical protein
MESLEQTISYSYTKNRKLEAIESRSSNSTFYWRVYRFDICFCPDGGFIKFSEIYFRQREIVAQNDPIYAKNPQKNVTFQLHAKKKGFS